MKTHPLDFSKSRFFIRMLHADILIPRTVDSFVATEKFVLNTTPNKGVVIGSIGSNFRRLFLDDGGKIEGPMSEHSLRCTQWRPSLKGSYILARFGKENIETSLSELFFLLSEREHIFLPHGESIIVFFIKDRKGNLQMVSLYYDVNGCRIEAHPVGESIISPHLWTVLSPHPQASS